MNWNYVYTVLVTTLAIILAEILGNYGLGDLVKDFILRIFHDAQSVAENAAARFQARALKFENKAKNLAAKVKAHL